MTKGPMPYLNRCYVTFSVSMTAMPLQLMRRRKPLCLLHYWLLRWGHAWRLNLGCFSSVLIDLCVFANRHIWPEDVKSSLQLTNWTLWKSCSLPSSRLRQARILPQESMQLRNRLRYNVIFIYSWFLLLSDEHIFPVY